MTLLKLIMHFLWFGLCYGKFLDKNVLKLEDFGGHGVDAVAISEKYIVFGSEFYGEGGEVVVCENEPGYKPIAKLAPPDVKAFDSFGFSVAVNNDFVIVGCRRCDDKFKNQGSVYIYKENKGDWTYQKLTANDGAKGDEFGGSVAINEGNELVVGAKNSDEIGKYSGIAYVYNFKKEWRLKQKLIPGDLLSHDFYGNAVSIANDYIAVSAQYSSALKPFVERAGNVYIFRRHADGIWVEDGKINSPNPEPYGGFGEAICIDADKVIVGTGTEDVETGNAYIFARINGQWRLESTLETIHTNKHAIFGSTVALHRNIAVVGTAYAFGDPYEQIGIGHVYKFVAGQWIEIQELNVYERNIVSSVAIYKGDAVAGCSNESYLFSKID